MEILRASDDERGRQPEPYFDGHPQATAEVKRRSPVTTGATDAVREEAGRAGAVTRVTAPAPLTITALKPALRDTRRVNIFVDDKFSFSLDLAQVADYHLKVGQVLTPEQLEELQHASDFGKLYQRTLEYVLSRPHSVKEVRDHLKRKQYTRQTQARRYAEFQAKLASDPDFKAQVRESRVAAKPRRERFRDFTENNENEYGAKSQRRYPTKPAAPISDRDIDQVITRLVDRGYLDDANFARYFVENRHVNKGVSTKKLRLDLRQKGIADDLIAQALATSPRDQRQEIQKMIQKKRRRGYDDQKLTQYLLRQGFDYELVQAALRETDSQSSE